MKFPVQALRFLRNNHNKIKGLFRQLERIDHRSHGMRAHICNKILREVEFHTQIENTYVYALIQMTLDDEIAKATVSDCFREHTRIIDSIKEIRATEPQSAVYRAKFNDFKEDVELHLLKEKYELFPKVQVHVGPLLVGIQKEIREFISKFRRQVSEP